MRNALCLVVLALAFAVPAAVERQEPRRRSGEWRQHAEAGPQNVAVLAVATIGASSLLFTTRDGWVATGVRLGRGGLAPWTVSW
jgi:hypothetical protein